MKRIVHSCSWWAFLLVLLPLGFPLPAHADGGAPNLAYVAGTTPGISVIDVARQQVSRTLAVPGSPQTVLLSPDGRFLYVTQPALGQVSVLAAQTGQTICTAQLPGHPTQLALNWDGTALYTASSDATTATELDTGTCAVRETWETHAPVFGLALATLTEGNTLQTQVWVAGATSLSIFDAHGQVLDNIPIPAGP